MFHQKQLTQNPSQTPRETVLSQAQSYLQTQQAKKLELSKLEFRLPRKNEPTKQISAKSVSANSNYFSNTVQLSQSNLGSKQHQKIRPTVQPTQNFTSSSNKSRSSKNSNDFNEQNIQLNTQPTANIRISHFHTNTAPINNTYLEEAFKQQEVADMQFLIKDKDTGMVYDIRNGPNVQSGSKQEYLSKLKKRHKSAWQGWWQQKRDNNASLLQFSRQNNTKEVEKLLEISSRDLRPEINTREDNGCTALHFACINGNYQLALLLLKNEADCDAVNSLGQTAIILCAQKGYDSIIQLLVTIGADLNIQDNDCNTAIHYACIFQHIKVAEILLARPSIQLNIKNVDGKTSQDLIENSKELRLLMDKHFKMKKESFNQCHKVQIYDNSCRDQRLISPSQKYYFSNQYIQSRYHSPNKQTQNETGPSQSQSNRSTVFINQSNYDPDQNNNDFIGPSNIRIILQIGKGSFGDVYLVEKRSQTQTRSGPKYAMKVLPKSKFIGHNLIRYALTERNVLSMLNHPFIVKLRYAFQTNTHLCLLMDYCPGGDLSKLIQNNKKIPESYARIYIAEILTALEHLHENDIIYRDLKPENIVLDMYGHAMLTDFGLSKEGVIDNYGAKSFCGSMAYLAPEMLKRVGHGRAVDWYHLGILLYEMIVGKPPYFSPNREEMLSNIENNRIVIPEYISKDCKLLIQQLLEKNPMARLGASQNDGAEIRQHPFFKQINWTDLFNRKYKTLPVQINSEVLTAKFDIPFDFILSPDNSSQLNYIQGWSFVNHDPNT